MLKLFKPLVSVIIPAYNAERFVTEAVESILSQTYRRLEVIVVDDGSTDTTLAKLKKFRTITIICDSHRGPGAARNRGVGYAKGDFIAFHDADDISLPHRIEEQMALLRRYPYLAYVSARLKNFVEPNTQVPRYLIREEMLSPRFGFISSAAMPRYTFDIVGQFAEHLPIGEDMEWLARAQRSKVISASLSEVLVHRRLHDQNTSSNLSMNHKNLFEIIRGHQTSLRHFQ